jgi:phosphoglycolate phosphatase
MPCISVTWGLRDKEFLLQNGAEILVDIPERLLGVIIV